MKLLILHCYGVYHKRHFYTEHPEQIKIYKAQLKKALQLLNAGNYDVLIISGGYTKPQVEKSEARGMLDWSEDLGLVTDKGIILLEEYAQDSFENLLFSMCRFFQFFGEFPASIGSCTWKFNIRRFEIFAQKLALPNFQVVPVGITDKEDRIAEKWAKLAKEDPFYRRQPDSAEKYLKRNPWEKLHPYAQINQNFQKLFIKLTELKERGGDLTEAKNLFPWI